MSSNTSDTPSRFTVLVPAPATRFNMGKPQTGEDAFGYPGISMKAEGHLFVDIPKIVHIQSGGNVQLQSGGHWEQFAYLNMNLAANMSATLAANMKVVVAAGAGQRNFATSPYGLGAPEWRNYNNLALHHLIDGIHSGLKHLFYGPNWKNVQKLDGPDFRELFFHYNEFDKAWIADDWSEWDKTAVTPIGKAYAMLQATGFHRKTHFQTYKSFLEPMLWKSDYASAMQGTPIGYTSEFPFLIQADPYTPTPVNRNSFGSAVMATLLQFNVYVQRMSDVIESLLPAIFDIPLFKRLRGLALAMRGFDAVIAGVNPKAWAPYFSTKENTAWARSFETDKEAVSELKWRSTRAELTSIPGPFKLATCSNFSLTIQDAITGTPKVVNLAALSTPATLTLTLLDGLTAIHLSLASSGTFVLDGQTVTYTAATTSFSCPSNSSGLPSGFAYDDTTGLLTKGGATFVAAAPSGGVAFEDRTFSEGAVFLLVDGKTNKVPNVAAFNGLTAAQRATNVAGALAGIGGVQASASGATVTLTTTTVGATASVGVSCSVAAHTALGLKGSKVGGGGDLTVEEAKELLESVGANYTVEIAGEGEEQVLEVKHNLEGKASYLKFSGDPATAIFGSNPALDQGEEPMDSAASMMTPLTALTELFEGTQLQQAIRPVTDAVAQVAALSTALDSAFKGLALFAAPPPPNPHLALAAGSGGITLAATGKITSVGHSVTLIAAGKEEGWGEPNKAKFIRPFLEEWVEKLHEMGDKVIKMGDKKGSPLDLLPKEGHIDAIANGRFTVVAKDAARILSHKEIALIAGVGVDIRASEIALTTGYANGKLSLNSNHVFIGDLDAGVKKDKDDKTPKQVTLTSDIVEVRASSMQLIAGGTDSGTKKPAIYLGGADQTKTAGLLLSDTTFRLGSFKRGVGGKADAETSLVHEKKVRFVVADEVAIEVEKSKVTFSGDVDVGGILTVKGQPRQGDPSAGTLEQQYQQAVTEFRTNQAQWQAERKARVAAIATLQESILTADKKYTELQKVADKAAGAAQQATKKLIEDFETKIGELLKEKAALENKLASIGADPIGDDNLNKYVDEVGHALPGRPTLIGTNARPDFLKILEEVGESNGAFGEDE